jgi:hypothetical protein
LATISGEWTELNAFEDGRLTRLFCDGLEGALKHDDLDFGNSHAKLADQLGTGHRHHPKLTNAALCP